MEANKRFEIQFGNDSRFIVHDLVNGKVYTGQLNSKDEDNKTLEQKVLLEILIPRGLGAVLPLYELRKVKENGNNHCS